MCINLHYWRVVTKKLPIKFSLLFASAPNNPFKIFIIQKKNCVSKAKHFFCVSKAKRFQNVDVLTISRSHPKTCLYQDLSMWWISQRDNLLQMESIWYTSGDILSEENIGKCFKLVNEKWWCLHRFSHP